MQSLLEVQDLKTHFHTRSGVVKAVDGVGLSINEGETLGIVGESGSGKSVTALSIMRLVATPPAKIDEDSKILFRGDDILDMDDEELHALRGGKISMIFQDPMTSLNPVFTVGFQITETIKTHLKISTKEAKDRTIEMMQKVRIPDARRRVSSYPHEFSGGMRQRVMIAIALACNPQLLIADEPTTALDVTIQAQILDLMRGLSREFGTSVMLITHDLGVVAGMCQRVSVMYAGRVVEEAPTSKLFSNPAHPYTKALLHSIPRLDEGKQERLIPIKGQPPDLVNLPPGCPFAPRCAKVQSRCLIERPNLEAVGETQRAACFYPF
ncbi:MAG TPA: ABC transporter ATP-binding protein [Ktedonobacterales bacterium]|jgi:oligopeptide transport system ATP-binding protein